MKKSYILILLATMMMLSGCDFFRKVAGRPTSDEIKVKKELVARAEALKAEQAREQAQEVAAKDSLAALVTLKEKGCMMYDLASLKGLASGDLQHRYYVVVGSFKQGSNVDKFMKKISKEPDMEPVKIYFRTGMVAVGVCPRNKVSQIATVIDEVRAKSFCPKDAWVLVNAEKNEIQ